jgi:hypothetical protein
MAPLTSSVDAAGRTRPGAAAHPVALSRDELIDGLALLALTLIGIVGFRPAYGGDGYLVAGAAGVIIGLVLSHAGQRARLPLLAVAAASVLAFLLFGGVVSETGTVSLPTLQALTSAVISGWQQLLTTARPVGRTAGLLALPYLLGLFSGVAGHALARRSRTVLLPAAAPAVVVALSILFGTPQPVDALLQGAGFTVAALAWGAVRQERGTGRQTTIGRQRPWRRIGAGALVLAVAGAGAAVIGPHLPGAGAHKRVVLTVVPPFDVDQYPSPLAAFRDYTKSAPAPVSVYGKELLSTTGLATGTLVRIAVMNAYNGLSWGVSNQVAATGAATGTFGGFQRVGALLPGAPSSHANKATITIEPAYDQPWLPDLAGTASFSFSAISGAAASSATCPDPGATGQSVAAELRYNADTGAGLIPGCVPSGLTYAVSYASVVTPSLTTLAGDAPGGDFDSSIEPVSAVTGFAATHAQGATTPMGKVVALARYLRKNGKFSDGGNGQSQISAGHSIGRLNTFLGSSAEALVGDGEQYAAAMALLADAVGVPARVSLDGAPGKDGVIKGSDVRADVELDTAEYGWVTLPASDFTSPTPAAVEKQLVTTPQDPVRVIPPRQNQAAPVAAANESSAAARGSSRPRASSGSGFVIPAIVITVATDAGIPVLGLTGMAAALVAAKRTRRRRRRSFGPPTARIAGAWNELTDLSRDLGIAAAVPDQAVPDQAGPDAAGTPRAAAVSGGIPTRREFAADAESRGLASARAVADAADEATFGPAEPDSAAVKRVWDLVEAARQASTAPLSRRRRWWIAVNPASLWRPAVGASRTAIARARRAAQAPAARGSGGRSGSGGSRDGRGRRRGRPVPGGAYR